MKGADDVFYPFQIDRGLASDRGINLSEQGGRDIIEVNPAHVDGSGKSRKVADDTAADSDDGIGAGKSLFEHNVAKLLKHGKAFASFALRN